MHVVVFLPGLFQKSLAVITHRCLILQI